MTRAEQIELACLMEATVPKPGNVHPGAAFVDLRYQDFVQAAHAVCEPLAATRNVGIGKSILRAVQATRAATGTNVNLGIVLLFAPLATVPDELSLERGLPDVLDRTTVDDAESVYVAIRLAQPGGLGQAANQDVASTPTVTLTKAMTLAADRDRIAEQYATDYRIVFEARRRFCELLDSQCNWQSAVVSLHLWMLARWPDSLIARKCGQEIAREASSRADALIESADANGRCDPQKLRAFDRWLREDGHRRNPGTTADLIAAVLFATMRDGLIDAPSRDEIEQYAAAIRKEFLP